MEDQKQQHRPWPLGDPKCWNDLTPWCGWGLGPPGGAGDVTGPQLGVPDKGHAIFGVRAQDPGIETVYGAKLATAQYPGDLRPKACSWPQRRASQLRPTSWALSAGPGTPLLPAPASRLTTSHPVTRELFPVSLLLWPLPCSKPLHCSHHQHPP